MVVCRVHTGSVSIFTLRRDVLAAWESTNIVRRNETNSKLSLSTIGEKAQVKRFKLKQTAIIKYYSGIDI